MSPVNALSWKNSNSQYAMEMLNLNISWSN